MIRTLHTDILEHFQAVLAMHTGSATVPMPSLGSWLSYGLGTLNPNLPPYVVLCEHLPYAGSQVWDSNFLPPEHQGTRLQPAAEPIPNLASPAPTRDAGRTRARMLRDVNEYHAAARAGDPNLRARIESFRTAAGMMRVAPEVFDLSARPRQRSRTTASRPTLTAAAFVRLAMPDGSAAHRARRAVGRTDRLGREQ